MPDNQPDHRLGNPDDSLGGENIDAAVANAEEGTQAEGDHVPSGQAKSGESRLERMIEVVQPSE